METIHNLIGPTQSILILGVIAIVLIWLIMKAIKQGSHNKQPPEEKKHPPLASRPIPSQDLAAKPVAQNKAEVVTTTQSPAISTIKPVAKSADVFGVPEDSVLRRHYLTEQAARKAANANPIPTDSILRRHYETLHQPVVVNRPKKTSMIEQAFSKDIQAVSPQVAGIKSLQTGEANEIIHKNTTPEDSLQKRHINDELQAEIHSGFSDRPTDSVLRRHYDHLIGLELKKRLVG